MSFQSTQYLNENFDDVSCDQLQATTGTINTLTSSTANITNLTVGDIIISGSSTIDFTNTSMEDITITGTATIQNATITNETVTGLATITTANVVNENVSGTLTTEYLTVNNTLNSNSTVNFNQQVNLNSNISYQQSGFPTEYGQNGSYGMQLYYNTPSSGQTALLNLSQQYSNGGFSLYTMTTETGSDVVLTAPTQIASFTTNQINLNEPVIMSDLTVNGNTTMNEATIANSTIAIASLGNTNITGTLTTNQCSVAGTLTVSQCVIDGNAQIFGTLTGTNETLTGTLTTSQAVIDGNAQIFGTTTTGQLQVNGTGTINTFVTDNLTIDSSCITSTNAPQATNSTQIGWFSQIQLTGSNLVIPSSSTATPVISVDLTQGTYMINGFMQVNVPTDCQFVGWSVQLSLNGANVGYPALYTQNAVSTGDYTQTLNLPYYATIYCLGSQTLTSSITLSYNGTNSCSLVPAQTNFTITRIA